MSPFSSFTFSSQLKTHNHFAFCALRFPNPFALTPETRVVPRRRPPPTTNIIMSFFGIGQSKLLSVDVTFATPTRTCVVKSSYTDANHVARETLPLITSGARREDDETLLRFSRDIIVSTTTLFCDVRAFSDVLFFFVQAIRSKAFCTSLQVQTTRVSSSSFGLFSTERKSSFARLLHSNDANACATISRATFR